MSIIAHDPNDLTPCERSGCDASADVTLTIATVRGLVNLCARCALTMNPDYSDELIAEAS